MTDKQNNPDPIAHAARLLRETAEELRQEYTLSSDRNNWRGDCVAKAAYDEHMAAAQALEDWEAAVGAGGVQPLRSVQEGCKLVPLEPTQEMLAALMSPGEAEVLASSPSETFALMLMDRAGIRERYSAMLAASPPAEQQAMESVLVDGAASQPPISNTLWRMLTGGYEHTYILQLPNDSRDRRELIDRACRNWRRICAEIGNSAVASAVSPQTAQAPQQAAPKAAPGDVLDEALRERDDAEDFIDALLDEVLGHERPEWSSSYGRADALNDVQERMTALHKPAVDKAWGRFQSAMAAPQQEAQEPALFVSAKQLADLGDPSHATGGSYLPARKTRAGLFTQPLYLEAPQPTPAPLSDDAKDAARWRWLSEHIGVAWNEGKFTSLVRIVSDKNRAALNASIDRMMADDWSDAAPAAQGGQ